MKFFSGLFGFVESPVGKEMDELRLERAKLMDELSAKIAILKEEVPKLIETVEIQRLRIAKLESLFSGYYDIQYNGKTLRFLVEGDLVEYGKDKGD